MNITFGLATLIALCVSVSVPLLVSLTVWSFYWIRINQFLAQPKVAGESRHLPRAQLEMLFSGQHYSFALLQPLHWALPWVILLLFFALPTGMLLDNGFTIGWWTLGAAVLVCIMVIVYVLRIADEYTLLNPPWWLKNSAVMTMVLLALLCGVALDTWLT